MSKNAETPPAEAQPDNLGKIMTILTGLIVLVGVVFYFLVLG